MSDENGIEIRSGLKPYVGKRIVIEGRVFKFGQYYDSKLNRNAPGVCLSDVDVIERPGAAKELRWTLTTHVWVTFSSPVSDAGAKPGDVIRASCLVHSYKSADKSDHNKSVTRYAMRDPIDVEIVRTLHDGYGDTPPPPVQTIPIPPQPPESTQPADPVRAALETVLDAPEGVVAALGVLLPLATVHGDWLVAAAVMIGDHGADVLGRALKAAAVLRGQN